MAVTLPTEEELDQASKETLSRVFRHEIGKITMSFAVFGDDIQTGEGLVAQVKRGALVQNMTKLGTRECMGFATIVSQGLRDQLAIHGAHLFQDFFLGIDEFASGRFIYDFENIPFSCTLEKWEEGPTGYTNKYHLIDHRPF